MRDASPRLVALVPARQGSKRVAGKNIRPLHGHPLIAYTIAAALDSGVCDRVIVSTDSEDIANIARHYGAEVPFLRPEAMASDRSPDIEWLEFTIAALEKNGDTFDCFALLRPTSPFRMPGTIQRAWQSFLADRSVDSLRAVEKCHEHPGKMWVIRGQRLLPLHAVRSRRRSRGTARRIRRFPRSTCRTPASRSRGRAWFATRDRSPAKPFCRS